MGDRNLKVDRTTPSRTTSPTPVPPQTPAPKRRLNRCDQIRNSFKLLDPECLLKKLLKEAPLKVPVFLNPKAPKVPAKGEPEPAKPECQLPTCFKF